MSSKGVSGSALYEELVGRDESDESESDEIDDYDGEDGAPGAVRVNLLDLTKRRKAPSGGASGGARRSKASAPASPGISAPAAAVSVRDWSHVSESTRKGVYHVRVSGAPLRRLCIVRDDGQRHVFILQKRHDRVAEIVADLVRRFPPAPGQLGGAASLVDPDTARRITQTTDLYHDQVVHFVYSSLVPPAAAAAPAPAAAAPSVEIRIDDDDDDENDGAGVDPDADIDDKVAMKRALQPASKSDAQIEAELDALLGAEKQHQQQQRAATRSVGKSRDWAAKSRDRLKSSFRDLASRLQQPKPAELNKAIIEAQLEELRALREAYDAPLLVVGDAVPLRLAFRLGGADACELAGRTAPSAVMPCQLCVVMQLPVAYPKAAASVAAFWALAPTHVDEACVARVDALQTALRAKCAAQVGQPLLHELMTDASDWLAEFVNDAGVAQAALEHAPSDEITEEHRVAWIQGLQWVFQWAFDQWPSPDTDYLFYEAQRHAALERLIEALVDHVRQRDATLDDEAGAAQLVGWVGAAPLDAATLAGFTPARRLLASGRTVMARFLADCEWSVEAAMRRVSVHQLTWRALEREALGVAAEAPSLQTPAHATQLLLAQIDAETGVEREVECAICLGDSPVSECTALPCGHWYCNGCYTSYVSLEVSEARATGLQCPAKDCAQPLGDVSALLLLGSSKSVARLLRFAAVSQVADDERAQQCLSNGCGQVLHARDAAARKALAPGAFAACDKCTAVKCMRCPLSAHWPQSCVTAQWARHVFKQRARIGEDDEELLTLRWIAQRTKDCPRCGTAIEKNLGCNHMRCQSTVKCDYEFCWVCLAPWTGSHYSCEAAKASTHTSIERYTNVPLSFVGLRAWHLGRLDFAKHTLERRVRLAGLALRDAGEYDDSRVLRDAFQWLKVARQLVINAAELGECLKVFSMPCQKHCKQFCVDVTAVAEQLHDVVFDEASRDPNRPTGPADSVDRLFNTMIERSVASAAGIEAAPRGAAGRRTTPAERAAVFAFSVAELARQLRSLNLALRTRLWSRAVAKRLPRLVAAAKAAGADRGDAAQLKPAKPEPIVVRVRVYRCGAGESVGKDLLVAGDWRVFVHEAAAAVGVIDDAYVATQRDPAAVYLRNGARVAGVDQLTHDDLVFVAPLAEPFQLPTLVEAAVEPTPAELRAAALADAEPRVPEPARNDAKWRDMMRRVGADKSDAERLRERLWQEHEVALLAIARTLPQGIMSHNDILTAIVNAGGAREALLLIASEIGATPAQRQAWLHDLGELLDAPAKAGGGAAHQPIADVWAMQNARNEADARRRVLEEAAQAEAVRAIRNVLPNVTDRQAARAWIAAGRNVELAMGQLLDGVIA